MKLTRILCFFGKHDLFMVRRLSDQAALCTCADCGRQWAIKTAGDCIGAGIPWAEAGEFYLTFPKYVSKI